MSLKKAFGLSLVVITAMSLSVVAMADDGVFADGNYSLTLPGLAAIEFTVATDGDETTVTAAATPEYYEVVDKSDSKESFENGDGLTIELKPSKVEADVVWEDGDVSLALPGGGEITVTFEGGEFDVTAPDGWDVDGSGGKWFVSNDTYRFKVEVDEDGVALKVADDDDDSAGDDAASNVDDDSSDDDD
ncbi:MAG: hypothetical protein OER90_19765, partial [Gemmatimonadota bacterium]|nr:hypothetical protein [Gemmatimonadota bacterium]